MVLYLYQEARSIPLVIDGGPHPMLCMGLEASGLGLEAYGSNVRARL